MALTIIWGIQTFVVQVLTFEDYYFRRKGRERKRGRLTKMWDILHQSLSSVVRMVPTNPYVTKKVMRYTPKVTSIQGEG